MKKKILTLALVIALIAIMVGGSLAYFTAEDEVTNTFTIGSVKIQIEEIFDDPETMIPVVQKNENDPNYVNKDAFVTNTGANDAYVQMFVAIPAALDKAGAFIVVDDNLNDWTARVNVGTATFTEDPGVTYNVYKYVYNKKLAPTESTSNVITAAYLAPELDYDHESGKYTMDGVTISDYTPGKTISIYVAAQAIQAEGFDSIDSALSNFGTHPWA